MNYDVEFGSVKAKNDKNELIIGDTVYLLNIHQITEIIFLPGLTEVIKI